MHASMQSASFVEWNEPIGGFARLENGANFSGFPIENSAVSVYWPGLSKTNPLPILTSKEEIDRQTIDCPYQPLLPQGLLPSGRTFKIRIGVNEKVAPQIPMDRMRSLASGK